MKKRIVITKKENIENVTNELATFSYVLKDSVFKGDNVKLIFVREEEISNELFELEEKYNSFNIPSFVPLIILMALTFVLLTALLIGIIILKDSSFKDIYLIALGIPSAISFISLSGYYYFRTSRMNKFIYGGDKLKEQIIKKAKEIKNGTNNV